MTTDKQADNGVLATVGGEHIGAASSKLPPASSRQKGDKRTSVVQLSDGRTVPLTFICMQNRQDKTRISS